MNRKIKKGGRIWDRIYAFEKMKKPLGYDWECGHEELYVRVNMYYDGSLYVGLWQKQEECKGKTGIIRRPYNWSYGIPKARAGNNLGLRSKSKGCVY